MDFEMDGTRTIDFQRYRLGFEFQYNPELKSIPTESRLLELIEEFFDREVLSRESFDSAEDRRKAYEGFREYIKSSFVSHVEEGASLSDKSVEPWTAACWRNSPREYWNEYRDILVRKNWSHLVISKLNAKTDEILDFCGNPQDLTNPWQLRGLVIGDVQSGKTAVYTGIINKAADAGYKAIIVLAGITEDLRKQTQKRLEAEFKKVSGGITCLTSVKSDFKTALHQGTKLSLDSQKEPVLFVVKKNSKILEGLCSWLTDMHKTSGKIKSPLLLIDDEADNASVNTKVEGLDPTAVNEAIRNLLACFRNASYCAFTATPFANVFIDPDAVYGDKQDLFPSNFIVCTDIPDNYYGVRKMLGVNDSDEESDDIVYSDTEDNVLTITDGEAGFPLAHKKDAKIKLPESLKCAIRQFLLINAIRDIRDQKNQHRSMMINVSRFTKIHNKLADLVEDYVADISEEIRRSARHMKAMTNPTISLLKEDFLKYFYNFQVDWKLVLYQLPDAIDNIGVYVVNQSKKKKDKILNYDRFKDVGIRAIVIGGLGLSRGVTLEGLCVSYLYRSTAYYDTLMQMGRWFGYRPGYEDICKVWMSSTTKGYFRDIYRATEELKQEIYLMNQAGCTPKDFGLRVRQSPDSLMITSRNKMRTGLSVPVRTSYSSYFLETPKLFQKDSDLNWDVTRNLLDSISDLGLDKAKIGREKSSGKFLFKKVPKQIVADFVNAFSVHPTNFLLNCFDDDDDMNPMARFIAENSVKELDFWDVVIWGKNPQGAEACAPLCGKDGVGAMVRAVSPDGAWNKGVISIAKGRVAGSWVEACTLSDEKLKQIEDSAARSNKTIAKRLLYRKMRDRPMLVLMPVMPCVVEGKYGDPDSRTTFLTDRPVITYALSFCNFADTAETSLVSYRANKIWQRIHFGSNIEDDDDEDVE